MLSCGAGEIQLHFNDIMKLGHHNGLQSTATNKELRPLCAYGHLSMPWEESHEVRRSPFKIP